MSTRGLDIRPGAGNAKNGEGERLGVAIRGDDVRFARQHDRLQFAGGVDECECVAHIGFFHDPVLCAPAAGLVILTGNSRTWLAIAVFTGHVKAIGNGEMKPFMAVFQCFAPTSR